MTVIDLGVIGCGDVAFRTYLPGLAPLGERARVVGCFDAQSDRAEAAARLLPEARAFGTLDELLESTALDAVVNLTPAPVHAEVTAQALRAGCHVYSEKPLAATVHEAGELIELAEARGKLLLCAPAVMATTRFQWIRELVSAGRIGRLSLAVGQLATMGPAAWREYTGDPAVHYGSGVGPLLDLGVYVLHAVTGLLGPALRVEAFGAIAIPRREVLIERLAGQTIDVAADDQVLLHLDFGHGVLAQVAAGFTVAATRAPVLELHGTEGTISLSVKGWYDECGPVELYADGRWQKIAPPSPSRYDHLIMAGVPHLVACLEGAQEPVLTAAHARHVLEIVAAAERSAREGCAVDLDTAF